ncbi:MAG: M23 family peptidase, partial [Nitrosopumilaceae archaeon]|nr:M23 family peptidase [Nitrosopumilaceae archaeon]
TFGSNGIPYTIYEYDLISQAASTEAFDGAEANGTPLEIIPVDNPGIQKDALPLDLSIV